jgi:hypothetical protein
MGSHLAAATDARARMDKEKWCRVAHESGQMWMIGAARLASFERRPGPPTGAGPANCQPRTTNHLLTRQVGARARAASSHLPGTVCSTDTEADLCACAVLTQP